MLGRHERQQLAIQLYARAMAIVDPLRVRVWNEAELTTSQLRVLMIVHHEPGATLRALAEHLRVAPPTASGLVDRLVRQGYLRREGDASDRRLVRHQLTDEGTHMVSELQREGHALLHDILSRLDDGELDALVRGLQLLSMASDAATQTEVTA